MISFIGLDPDFRVQMWSGDVIAQRFGNFQLWVLIEKEGSTSLWRHQWFPRVQCHGQMWRLLLVVHHSLNVSNEPSSLWSVNPHELWIQYHKAGMSNSNPCAGRKMTFKDWKIVSGQQFVNIFNFFSVQKPFHTKICQF